MGIGIAFTEKEFPSNKNTLYPGMPVKEIALIIS
jgi:hypothetical protein